MSAILDGIYDQIAELFDELKIERTDEITDLITEKSNAIYDGISEAYYASGDYVADCNLKESVETNSKIEIKSLENKIRLLEHFIQSKGYSFSIKGSSIYDVGMEHTGGTVYASYEREVR